MTADNVLQLATELVTNCHLPELTIDIDSQPFERAHFQKFNDLLNTNLHLLLDLIQINGEILFEHSKETINFQTNLILLLCEQTKKTDFQTDQIILQQNIHNLQSRYFQKILLNNTILKNIFDEYKTKIKLDRWKRNIGAVYGLSVFCEVTAILRVTLFVEMHQKP